MFVVFVYGILGNSTLMVGILVFWIRCVSARSLMFDALSVLRPIRPALNILVKSHSMYELLRQH
jgi:hypothetical protein